MKFNETFTTVEDLQVEEEVVVEQVEITVEEKM